MRKLIITGIALYFMGFAVPSLPARAQYGKINFNELKTITLKGTLERFEFGEANILLRIAVQTNGTIQHWLVTMSAHSVAEAKKVGWSQSMMRPGDSIEYEVLPESDGRLVARGGNIITVNGKKIGAETQPEKVSVPAYTD